MTNRSAVPAAGRLWRLVDAVDYDEEDCDDGTADVAPANSAIDVVDMEEIEDGNGDDVVVVANCGWKSAWRKRADERLVGVRIRRAFLRGCKMGDRKWDARTQMHPMIGCGCCWWWAEL